ncbi:MAG: 50S ribosome-binding GTPase [Planctomycetaceae bacterium]|jgi:hypothetical protein|nr:50S ribosome-binding GTPase [Planctomycetaceae bacterium]
MNIIQSHIDEGELFIELSELAVEFDCVVGQLLRIVGGCGVLLSGGDDWYELLSCKLLPQVGDRAYLIISVMGGTNTGKSVIFNHLVGNYCSGVDYRASGTKHPVCVVSGAISDSLEVLRRNFCNFNLVAWSRSEQPLEQNNEHQLFWRVDDRLSDRLLILDTPDIDSDNELNWTRARGVRHAADVIVAVLTSQKYNDAAVRRFFRESAESAKPVIVIFNMIDPEHDAEHIPIWLNQFCEETHSVPIAVLAAPFDIDKAAGLQLPFYQVSQDGKKIDEVADLRRIFTELHFDRIKSQTLIGAIRVIVDDADGLPSFLRRIEIASGQFGEALEAIECIDDKTEMKLPTMPSSILAEGMRTWWNDEKRPAWVRKINDIYRAIGSKLVYPFSKFRKFIVQKLFARDINIGYQLDDSLQHFKNKEEGAVVSFIETVFGQIERLAETDNLVLRREMLDLISGEMRVEILARAKVVLNELEPAEVNFDKSIKRNLKEWADKNPVTANFIKCFDVVLTLVRLVFTVLFIVGGFILGSAITTRLLGIVLVTSFVVIVGEAVMYTLSETLKLSLAKLIKHIQDEFVVLRAKKFHTTFLKELWHDIITRLKSGAAVANSKEFKNCQECLQKAKKALNKKN